MTTYRIHYILPAMAISDEVTLGPAVFCTTGRLGNYAITPPEDANAVCTIARQYCPGYGRPLGRVGLMLIPAASAKNLIREGIPRMCRDALALCFITRGTALNCHLVQPRHNADFWERLERVMPDFASRKEWLAANGGEYI